MLALITSSSDHHSSSAFLSASHVCILEPGRVMGSSRDMNMDRAPVAGESRADPRTPTSRRRARRRPRRNLATSRPVPVRVRASLSGLWVVVWWCCVKNNIGAVDKAAGTAGACSELLLALRQRIVVWAYVCARGGGVGNRRRENKRSAALSVQNGTRPNHKPLDFRLRRAIRCTRGTRERAVHAKQQTATWKPLTLAGIPDQRAQNP